jgi:hypothetical protein
MLVYRESHEVALFDGDLVGQSAMNYLQDEYGIVIHPMEIHFNSTDEKMVFTTLGKAVQIVDKHCTYWGRTSSQVTLRRFIDTKICLQGLVAAITYVHLAP